MKHIFTLFLSLLALTSLAQSRNVSLTIEVLSVPGDNLSGQEISLEQTDYQLNYGQLTLDAEGKCSLNVYAGNHQLTVNRAGFETAVKTFSVTSGTTETVSIQLSEKTRTPFALQSALRHDAYTGNNAVDLTWNTEAPAFFDDFESYEGWSVQFGQWTGIDADLEVAAPLVGNYPNRGVMQYAQIINPLTVEPTWWYDYPILRPYEGSQYVGFTRTSSGNANDDWLISPVITVGTDNVLQFMGKAADQFAERFQVYVTTQTDSPEQSNFVRLDQDNYETADYRGWRRYSYDLSAYAGQQIKFAIRYISHYNLYRSFMLMIDNVYVGQPPVETAQAPAKSRRVAKSPANPNERFYIFVDGEKVGETTGYNYTIENLPAGAHTIGVKAVYIAAQSDVVSTSVEVPAADSYARIVFSVTANSKLGVDGQQLSLINTVTSETYTLTVADGQAVIASLPKGSYVVNVAEGAFNDYQQSLDIQADATIDIVLTDHIINPYNITVTKSTDGQSVLRWNQELGFNDSFEDYEDFATGSFGDWLTIDNDKLPVYPISLGSMTNIVSFPGSGTANNPTAIAPMVFNPWNTNPAMLPTDPAVKAPTGDKTIIFMSAQRGVNDKWLISPLIDVHDNYVFQVTAKAYAAAYPETMEFCISDGSTRPEDFHALAIADPLSEGQWSRYETPLTDYAGQQVRLGIHYVSNDAFFAQIDDFFVGQADGGGETVDFGNVVRFEIYIDGTKVAETTTPSFVLPELSAAQHTIGIKAVYQSAESQTVDYLLDLTTGVGALLNDKGQMRNDKVFYDLQGRQVVPTAKGLYIVNGKKHVK